MVGKLKKTLATIVAASWLALPGLARANQIDYEALDKQKQALERVDYTTFRTNLDSGASKSKIENQDKILELISQEMRNQGEFTEGMGYNFRRGVDEEKFSKFIFEDILKDKLKYEIKTPTDVIVGINMALEYLVKYNHKMLLSERSIGSDINDDGKFEGVDWSYLKKVDKSLMKKIIKDPSKAYKICDEENKKTDGTPPDMLLMKIEDVDMSDIYKSPEDKNTHPIIARKYSWGRGKPDSVEMVCRNYVSAMQIMFETAQKKYPSLTKDLDLLLLPMPGHVFGAFVNKKTLEYIVVDPTWHDSGKDFKVETMVFDNNDRGHYDQLKEEALFQVFQLDKELSDYLKTSVLNIQKILEEQKKTEDLDEYKKLVEKISEEPKRVLREISVKIQDLAKKHPKNSDLITLEFLSYLFLTEHKEDAKAFELIKGLYDNKEKLNVLPQHFQIYATWMLGQLSFELKNYKDAVKYYEEASRTYVRENVFVYASALGVAKSNFELGNYHEAMFRAKDLLDLHTDRDINYTYKKKAKEVVEESAKRIFGKKKKEGLKEYLRGDYRSAIKKLKGDDAETKLLLAESNEAINHYQEAKRLYTELSSSENAKISSLAKSEMGQMKRKHFLYGYMHFFDEKSKDAVKDFEFLKNEIDVKDPLADRVSLFLMWSYDSDKEVFKALQEASYFMKNFPESSYKSYVQEYVKSKVVLESH